MAESLGGNMGPVTGRMKPVLWALFILNCSLFAGVGCRQKMANQPYHRPYETSDMFEDKRASRPLERGVVHRAQYLDSDPLVTGLTAKEWGKIYTLGEKADADGKVQQPQTLVKDEDRESAHGLPRFDQRKGEHKVFVEAFPFEITTSDLERGQERYTIYCAVCHGPLGNGQGKIWERGYLNPTSFHTEKVSGKEADVQNAPASPLGHSRGYALWGITMPLREAPVGYIYEVITKGYGGMPSYSAQIPPADRWRIVAYVRALQDSQHAPANPEPAGGKK